ncbi:MAG: hypothetical protein ACRDOL_42185 [Streptosporangiaceae bacterium]
MARTICTLAVWRQASSLCSRQVLYRLTSAMVVATSPRLVNGISARSETKKLLNRAVNAEPATALEAAGAPLPSTVSGRSEAATKSSPISAPAAVPAAVK